MSYHIQLKGVTTGYNGEPVLRNLNFEVAQGEFVAVLGPNASGKTTLLRVIAKSLLPLEGAVFISGRNLEHIPPRALARQVGVVPQEDHIGFDFTSLEIVAMGRYPYLKRLAPLSCEDWRKIEWAMQSTNTTSLKHRPVTAISGGERKRVILARALAQEPEILLLDEPTSNLDINYQKEILSLLQQLNAEHGLTVLLVIHDINLAALVAKRILMLNRDGSIHALGTPEEVLTEEHLETVYGTDLQVEVNAMTGKPRVSFQLEHGTVKTG